MTAAPAPHGNPLIVEQFEKELKFLQLVLLLINKSSPIKRVDLVWAADGPAGRVGLRQCALSTERALAGPYAALLACGNIPEPKFCYTVNDHGRHEAESCAISDKAAELRVRQTGKAEVYTCNFGMVDIAVPVIAEGEYIATLFAGQVLGEQPSKQAFVQIQKRTAALGYIDSKALQKAYWQVPVVSPEDIERATRVLEIFAEHLATVWTRVLHMVRDEQRRFREAQLERKEFAHLVLQGNVTNRPVLRQLMGRLGFTRYPNCVMVVRLESGEDSHGRATSFELERARASQAVEELCERTRNMCSAYLRDHGICVFFRDREDAAGASPTLTARAFAERLLRAVRGSCDLRVRIGIGGPKPDWHDLPDSYHEACLALAQSPGPVAIYLTPRASSEELSLLVGQICRHISDRRLAEARMLIVGLPLAVNREIGDRPENLPAQRRFLAYVLDSMSYAARQAGAGGDDPGRTQTEGEAALNRAAVIFELQQAFLAAAEALLNRVRLVYAGRREKIVERVCRIIEHDLQDRWLAQSISIEKIAASLGISPGHLTRIFKRTTGLTCERYIMNQRVAAAQRMLLEPLATVSDVAEKCGFADPAYFARVFRKVSGRSPSEYRNEPMALS
jgi:AraC-like DNA-binding protein/ligand-binding sensor protein